MPLLEVDELGVQYETPDGPLQAVEDVSFNLEKGDTLGVVGESGCGKTTLIKSILQLLPDNGHVSNGEVRFDGQTITDLDKEEFRTLRWTEISYIVQNAMNALDPVYTAGQQIVEVIRAHTNKSKSDAWDQCHELLESVGLDAALANDYPHELSGGQRQRVVIALALALDPALIIADECTTGLDVVVQNDILNLISDIQSDLDSAMIFVTHDISVVAEIADRVVVMYGGRRMELGTTEEVLREGAHPYTLGLKHAFPTLEEDPGELVSIPGSPPDLITPPDGCRFVERCPFATEECMNLPPMETLEPGHQIECHYPSRIEKFREESAEYETWIGEDRSQTTVSSEGEAQQ